MTDDPFGDMQRAYWQVNAAEKAALLARYPHQLSWAELLRLHHLNCMELLSDGDGKAALMGEETTVQLSGAAFTLCKELVERLAASESPFRPRHCLVWQIQNNSASAQEQRQPDFSGVMTNASLTHLGSVEFIRMDSQQRPTEIGFAALDDIQMIGFGSRILYRPARILFEDGRDEIVAMPLLYGVSWQTNRSYDHDGSMTRFCCHLHSTQLNLSLGIGIGHQDFKIVSEENQRLFGMGSLYQVSVALDMTDPRFDEKCRNRGIDPDEVRRNLPQ